MWHTASSPGQRYPYQASRRRKVAYCPNTRGYVNLLCGGGTREGRRL